MFERIGYVLLSIVALAWLAAMVTGMVVAFPVGIIGLLGILGIGFLLIKVVKDRINNPEDDYYDKHVDQ
ncbi:MAG: hypothetical protein KDC35_03280 [Acidobacteria bacterium]|nr:hypothetical protein [Acidobacteriota bacterium]